MKEKNKIVDPKKAQKKKKFLHALSYSGLFLVLFGVTACTAYYLIPNNTKSIAEENTADPEDDGGEQQEQTPEQLLISNLTNLKGLQADITANVSIPNEKDSANPDIVTLSDTSLKLVMQGWPNIAFSLKSTLGYNGVSKSIALSYADKNVYLSALGVKYKTTNDTRDSLADDVYTLFKEASLPTIDASSIDTSAATSVLNNMTHTGDATTGYTFTVPVFQKTETLPEQDIFIATDGDCDLKKVWATSFDFKGVKITFELNTNTKATFEESAFIPTDSDSYLDVYKSVAILHRVKELVDKKQAGLTLSAAVSKDVTDSSGTVTSKGVAVTSLSGSAALDANAENYGLALQLDTPYEEKETVGGVETTVKKTQTQLLGANYVGVKKSDGTKDGTIYASYNDAFKLSMTVSTLQSLIDKIKADFPQQDTASTSKAFAFITESTVMKSVLKGHYQEVINMLQSVTAKDNGLEIDVSMKGLGLGDDSLVKVVLNANETSWASISVANLKLSNYYLNCTLSLADYAVPSLDTTAYETLDKLTNVYDQVYALSQSQQAGVDLSGSIDYGKSVGSKAMTGFTFTGDTEFDIKSKSGTGAITIASKTEKFVHNHQVTIDVRGTDSMLFKYTSDATNYQDALYGKNSIKTLNDIIDVVKGLMNSTDERYTKFSDPLKEQAATMVVGKIAAGDYEELLKKKLLTSLHVHSDAIELTISKDLLGSDSDIDVSLGLDDANKIKNLVLSKFVIKGVTINLSLTLKAFDPLHITKLPDESAQSYMDFSDIAVLLKFGIKTSELAYYHISGTAGVSLLGLTPFDFDVDFHISVNGKTVKVVGTMKGIPLAGGVNGSASVGLGTRDVTFIYETGYCYIIGSDDYTGFLRDSTDHVKVKDSYFASNLTHYLLNNILQLSDKYQKQIDTSSQTAATTAAKYEDVLKSFVASGTDGNTPSWALTLDVGALAQTSALGDLTCTIKGTTDSNGGTYLSSIKASLKIASVVEISLDASLTDIGKDDSSYFSTTWQGLIDKWSYLTAEGA
jgi:hypothetical protein